MTAKDPLLTVNNLQVDFKLAKKGHFRAVKGINFTIPVNQTVALVGESGSGKSVTSLAILGLLPKANTEISPASEIIYQDKDLLKVNASQMRALRGKEISMIFQEPMSSLNPVLTVGRQVSEVLKVHLGLSEKKARVRTLALLQEVGITDPEAKIDAYPFELSGGQQQRIMIAMAIACEPKLLIADEPTTALDVTIQQQILELLKQLQVRHCMSILFITHDLAVVADIADTVIVMRQGEICEQGPASSLFAQPSHPYTQALLQCRPRLDQRPYRLPVISDFMEENEPIRKKVNKLEITPTTVLQVKNLSKDYPLNNGFFSKKKFTVINNVSFNLAKGKTLGLVGESGSGKTTLGLTLMRLQKASAGEVWFEGKELLGLSPVEFSRYKSRIQIIFQNPYASLNPRFTVGQILLEPMQIHRIGANEKIRQQLVFELLHKVGLEKKAFNKYPHEFSGGQRQRIAIARCLTMKPDVLICDESVSALDVSVQAQVLNLLQDLQEEYGLSYIFISHDLAVVKYISDRVMVMQNGQIVEEADADQIYLHPQHPYTQRLLSAIPKGWEGKSQ